jgi:phosphoserine phosphatase RsbU/P
MKSIIKYLRCRWYIIILFLLLIYHARDITFHPLMTEYDFSPIEMAHNATDAFIGGNRSEMKSFSPAIRYLSGYGYFTTIIEPRTCTIKGYTHVFNDSVYAWFRQKLDTKQYQHLSLANISDKELDEFSSFVVSPVSKFDFWSTNYHRADAIYHKFNKLLSQPMFHLYIYHTSDSSDSTIILTYQTHSEPYKYNMKENMIKDMLMAFDQPDQPKTKEFAMLIYSFYLFLLGSSCLSFLAFLLSVLFLIRGTSLAKQPRFLEIFYVFLYVFPKESFKGNLYLESLLSLPVSFISSLILIAVVATTPNPLSRRQFWKWILLSCVILLIFINYEINYYTLLISVMLITIPTLAFIQLARIKGLQKKIIGHWFGLGYMTLLVYIITVIVSSLTFVEVINSLCKYLGWHYDWLFQSTQVAPYFDNIILIIESLLFILMLAYPWIGFVIGLLEYRIEYFYRLRRWSFGLAIWAGLFYPLYLICFIEKKSLTQNFFVLFFLGLFITLVAFLFIRKTRFLYAVRHDPKKFNSALIESSFRFKESSAYFNFFKSELGKLYPKVKIGITVESERIECDPFVLPTPEMLAAISSQSYFNLDIARINKLPAADSFPEWIPPKKKQKSKNVKVEDIQVEEEKLTEVHLFYTLMDFNDSKIGYIFIGDSGKLYWDKENTDFIKEAVRIFNSFYNNIRLNNDFLEEQVKLELEKQERNINQQLAEERQQRNHELEEINREIMDSITYAALIQRSILPNSDAMDQYLQNYFVFWQERDVVGGDYYWFYPLPEDGSYLLAVIDCTGHGVPGAFMTLMTNSILNSIVRDRKIIQPDEILNHLHREVRFTLQQNRSERMKDGLDISLIKVYPQKRKCVFSGSQQRALLIHQVKGEVGGELIFGVKSSIGGSHEEFQPDVYEFEYHPSDKLYLFTDGLIDQPVLLENCMKKMTRNQWTEQFIKWSILPMEQQKAQLAEFIKKQLEQKDQRDDITVIGIKFY